MFSDIFLCKDPMTNLRHGFLMDADASADRFLGAAQIARLSTSEMKSQYKVITKVMNLGLNIHPLILIWMATNIYARMDGDIAKTGERTDYVSNSFSYNYLYATHSSHLPFCGNLKSIEQVKTYVEDRTDKADYSQLSPLSTACWGADSRQVFMRGIPGVGPTAFQPFASALAQALTTGEGTNLNKGVVAAVEEEEPAYDSAWAPSTQKFKNLMLPKAAAVQGGTPINFLAAEAVCIQYGLIK
jgi:hypothetical protein